MEIRVHRALNAKMNLGHMENQMKTTALMIAAGLLAAGGAAAQDAQAGAATFARYCAACHGEEAQGGGPSDAR